MTEKLLTGTLSINTNKNHLLWLCRTWSETPKIDFLTTRHIIMFSRKSSPRIFSYCLCYIRCNSYTARVWTASVRTARVWTTTTDKCHSWLRPAPSTTNPSCDYDSATNPSRTRNLPRMRGREPLVSSVPRCVRVYVCFFYLRRQLLNKPNCVVNSDFYVYLLICSIGPVVGIGLVV